MTGKMSFLNYYYEVRSCQRDEEKGRLLKIRAKVRGNGPIFLWHQKAGVELKSSLKAKVFAQTWHVNCIKKLYVRG